MVRHLACIMDGNRRWAKQHNRHPEYGHTEGVEAVKRVIDFCLMRSIAYLSLYTFSLENEARASSEKEYLFRLLVDKLHEGAAELIARGIRVRFVGQWSSFPESIVATCKETERQTAGGTKLQLSFLVCYGAQQEITAAAVALARDACAGTVNLERVTRAEFQKYLSTDDIPFPEIIIRTSGHRRLSNFLLYQAAYSELYFLDCLWPDISVSDLESVVEHFIKTQRNFGA